MLSGCGVEAEVEPSGGGSGGPVSAGEEAGDDGGSTGQAGPHCRCWARCVEYNPMDQPVAFTNVDVDRELGPNGTCPVTQEVQDLLYYACADSVIHPWWAQLDDPPNFQCRVVGG